MNKKQEPNDKNLDACAAINVYPLNTVQVFYFSQTLPFYAFFQNISIKGLKLTNNQTS